MPVDTDLDRGASSTLKTSSTLKNGTAGKVDAAENDVGTENDVGREARSGSFDYDDAVRRFDEAAAAYKAQADPLTLLLLNKSAIPLLDIPAKAWKSLEEPDVLSAQRPFTAIRVLCDRRLSLEEVSRLCGCLGYALQATLAGPDLSPPDVSWMEATGRLGVAATFTLLVFAYEAQLSIRTAPDYAEAFAKARAYIREGTPVRTTGRAGAGTQGTRLVEGIGDANLTLYVR